MASAFLLLGQAASEDTFTTEDWLVPLITAAVGFLGAVLGVVAGERISRQTQIELEAERSRREREVDERRAEEAKATENRLVRAVCRVLEGEFENAKRTVGVSAKSGRWWPDGHPVDITLPLEDRRLLAAHLPDHAWEIIALAEHALVVLTNKRTQEMGPEPPEPRLGFDTNHDFANDIPAIDSAINILTEMRGHFSS